LIAAVELVADRDTREPFAPAQKMGLQVYRELLRRGVIVRTIGDTLALCPPYVIKSSEIEHAIDELRNAIDAVTGTTSA